MQVTKVIQQLDIWEHHHHWLNTCVTVHLLQSAVENAICFAQPQLPAISYLAQQGSYCALPQLSYLSMPTAVLLSQLVALRLVCRLRQLHCP